MCFNNADMNNIQIKFRFLKIKYESLRLSRFCYFNENCLATDSKLGKWATLILFLEWYDFLPLSFWEQWVFYNPAHEAFPKHDTVFHSKYGKSLAEKNTYVKYVWSIVCRFAWILGYTKEMRGINIKTKSISELFDTAENSKNSKGTHSQVLWRPCNSILQDSKLERWKQKKWLF